MGVATGCGFKEIYRFPHTTLLIPTPLVSVLFAAASLLVFRSLYNYSKRLISNKTA